MKFSKTKKWIKAQITFLLHYVRLLSLSKRALDGQK